MTNPHEFRILNALNESTFFSNIKDKEEFVKKIYKVFNFDIVHEIKKADAWLTINTQKKYKRYDKFLLNWLLRRDANVYR